MSETSPGVEGLSLPERLRVSEACEHFEDAWLAGRRPRIEDFLVEARGAEREALLRGLEELDLHYRSQPEEMPTRKAYSERLPEDGPLVEAIFETETRLRPDVAVANLDTTCDISAESCGPERPLEARGEGVPDPIGPPALPGYEVLEELGRGAMGVVYKARQASANRVVALKMILAGGHAGQAERERFQREAEATACLQHPPVVQLFEVGEHGGHPFLCMEFCAGGNLASRLSGTPMAPQAAAELVQVLARAVQAAHEVRIVHRDLKPANVLFGAGGAPKVSDFGLAKRMDAAGGAGSEAIVGTPSYMAPEQAVGGAKEVGAAADVYALGAILYECLTGRPPFMAATLMDTLMQVIGDEPVPPRQFQPTVPRDLETICLKCLRKEPAKRYVSAEELGDDLRCFVAGEPIRARPVGRGERAWKWAKRRPTAAALLLITGLGMAALLVGTLVLNAHLSELNKALTGRKNEAEGLAQNLDGKVKELDRKSKTLTQSEIELQKAFQAVTLEKTESQQSFEAAQDAVDKLIRVVQDRLRMQKGIDLLRRALLRDALVMCTAFKSRVPTSTSARVRVGQVNRMIGDLHELLGEPSASAKSYRDAIEMLSAVLDKEALSNEQRQRCLRELLAAHINLWSAMQAQGAPGAEQALDAAERLLGKGLPQQALDAPEVVRVRAGLHNDRGILRLLRDDLKGAEAEFLKAEKVLSAPTERPALLLERARTGVNFATLWAKVANGAKDRKRAEEANAKGRRLCEQARRSLTSLLDRGYRGPALAKELARACSTQAKLETAKVPARAEKLYQDAVERFEKMYLDNPRVPDYVHLLALTLGNLGDHYRTERRPEEAECALAEACQRLKRLADDYPEVPGYRLDQARTDTMLGVALLAFGRFSRAQRPLEDALALLDVLARASPDNDTYRSDRESAVRNLLICHERQARELAGERDWSGASAHVKRLIEMRRARLDALLAKPLRPWDLVPWTRSRRERLQAREDLAGSVLAQARLAVAQGDHAGAFRTLEDVFPLLSPDEPTYEGALRVLARCMSLVAASERLREAERDALSHRYGAELMSRLFAAAEYGAPGLAELVRSDDFAVLRRSRAFRARFRRLLNGVADTSRKGGGGSQGDPLGPLPSGGPATGTVPGASLTPSPGTPDDIEGPAKAPTSAPRWPCPSPSRPTVPESMTPFPRFLP